MTIDTMIKYKKIFGYSNQIIAKKSGVPLSTVQKIFSGCTDKPRYSTLQALSEMFMREIEKGNAEKKIYEEGMLEEEFYLDEVRETGKYNSKKNAKSVVINSGTSADDRFWDGNGKTIDDYYALPDDVRVELIDGVFYDMACPTFAHQRISGIIYKILDDFIDRNGGSCIPMIAPFDVRLDCDNKTMVQPDVLVICDIDRLNRRRVEGAPDLVIEVVSASNWYNDMVIKLRKYKNAGVREYWIVIPDQKKVLVYNFEKNQDAVEYTFEDKVPVGIWDGKCEVDFRYIYDKISFMM